MGRERQKKKNRSSISKARPRDNRTKAGKRKVNFLGNETIAKNWDRKLTMSQNYKRLGLSSKLNATTGGTEKKANKGANETTQKRDSLAITAFAAAKLQAQEVQVERDPETGRIIKVVRPDDDEDIDNPLNDPLNEVMEYENGAPSENTVNDIVAQLEAQAAAEEASLANKRPRQQSQREADWVTKLIAKHGDDIKAMVRDRKLNPMQQTEGDIGRRVRKWKASHKEVTS